MAALAKSIASGWVGAGAAMRATATAVERPRDDLGRRLERQRCRPSPRCRARRARRRRRAAVGALEHDHRARRHRGAHRNAQQLEVRELGGLGNLVEAEEQVLAEKREQLDERDAGIARVVIGPLRRVDRNAPHQLVAELLVRPVVEDRRWKRHALLQVEREHEIRRPVVAHVDVGDANEHERRVVAWIDRDAGDADARLEVRETELDVVSDERASRARCSAASDSGAVRSRTTAA